MALPLINRELADQGLHLYRYVPATDRLYPYGELTLRLLDRERAGAIPSDGWYRALCERDLRVEVAFDVGVNYGYTCAWLSCWAERVYAFEPHPRNAALIREHLRIRQLGNVELCEAAVADEVGEATLHVRSRDGHHSLGNVGASEVTSELRVPATTVDRAASERGIGRLGLLKIDVEGFEPEVLEGAGNLLAARAIDLILFEYSPGFYRRRGIDPRAPLAVLERFGYCVTALDGGPVDETVWQTDLLARPASP